MTYRKYIKKDYKPADSLLHAREQTQGSPSSIHTMPLLSGFILLTAWISFGWVYPVIESTDGPRQTEVNGTEHSLPILTDRILTASMERTPPPKEFIAGDEDTETIPWRTIIVQQGDNMSLIFKRINQSPAVLHAIMSAGEHAEKLKRLLPGEEIDYLIEHDQLISLRFEPEPGTTLLFEQNENGYSGQLIKTELSTAIRDVHGVIEDSLFLAGQEAGLSDNLIMRLVAIYGWDIDFALEIRAGDHFRVLYEEQYLEGVKVRDGNILVAEFTNRGKPYRAVRYTSPEGETGFYNELGFSMRKAFLRTPLKFDRISSQFNPNRRHPILNMIRAHKGVDYAAPTGTPIKATGDGTVLSAGRNGGYGNAVVLRHGGMYETLYAHLSHFAKGIVRTKHVRQGDIIGYVGQTGLASGPHLHYEFRVNGVHRNPLTVELPKALQIPDNNIEHFQAQTGALLARLNSPSPTATAENDALDPRQLLLALKNRETQTTSVR